MTGSAIVHDTGMIGEGACKSLGVMAITTIASNIRVAGYCGRLTGCVNTIVIIVA